MKESTITYLKQDQIGKVIAKGLAEVYRQRPQTPIKYLAQWLKSYSKNQKELQHIVKHEQQKHQHLKIYNQSVKIEEMKKMEIIQEDKRKNDKIHKFMKMIQQHEYQEQLLLEEFPEFIEKLLKLTGVYIGQLNHPRKNITEEDTDEKAHLDLSTPKLINYIGSSISHSNLMRGQTLTLDKGVTGAAFTLAEDQPPKLNQQGQEIVSQPQPKYIYVPNVVKNQKIHYFRLPKLGAYIAIPLIYNSYLSEPIFDAALLTRKKYLQDLEEFNKNKEDQLKQLSDDLADSEKRLAQLIQKNADETQLEPIRQQIKDINEKIKQKHQQKLQQPQPNLPLEKRQFVFAADNIGIDSQLKMDDINFMMESVKHFKTCWENKEKQLLKNDVQKQIDYLRSLDQPLQNILEHIDKATTINEQTQKQLAGIQNETLRNYKQEQLEYISLKKYIDSEHKFLEAFLKLKDFRVVKYKKIIQNTLYFLGFKKKQINIPGKTIIDWKTVKDKYITKQIYEHILGYVVQGSKTGQFEPYSKTTYLSEIFDQFHPDEIFQYNIGLAALCKLIQKALKHRLSNIEWRKMQKQIQKKQREQLLIENQKIDQEKAISLEKHKISLSPQQVESFSQDVWIENYYKQHPLKQVPPQVVDDIDNDI